MGTTVIDGPVEDGAISRIIVLRLLLNTGYMSAPEHCYCCAPPLGVYPCYAF